MIAQFLIAEAEPDFIRNPTVWLVISIIANVALSLNQFCRLGPELKKIKSDTDKAVADIISNQATTLAATQAARDRYDEAVKQLTSYFTYLVRLIENDESSTDIDQAREIACEKFTSLIAEHRKYVEFAELCYLPFPGKLFDFIVDDLCNSLNRFSRWLRVLNSPELLQKIDGDRSLLVITKITTKPYCRIATELSESIRTEANSKLNPAIDELLRAGNESVSLWPEDE